MSEGLLGAVYEHRDTGLRCKESAPAALRKAAFVTLKERFDIFKFLRGSLGNKKTK